MSVASGTVVASPEGLLEIPGVVVTTGGNRLVVKKILTADVPTIRESTGGAQVLSVSAGSAHAGKLYWILGTASGTLPGLPSVTQEEELQVLPLNADAWFTFTLTAPNTPVLSGSLGALRRRRRRHRRPDPALRARRGT